MDLKARVTLIAGSHFDQRSAEIERIKKNIFKNGPDLSSIFIFSAFELDLERLKEAAFTLTLSGEKLILIRQTEDLDAQVKDFLKDNLEKIAQTGHIAFESGEGLDFLKAKKIKAGCLRFWRKARP